MAIKSADQISIIDVTDAYSVILSSESHTFQGNYASADAGGTCTTTVFAMRGSEVMPCTVSNITVTPTGAVTAKADTNTTNPTITVTTTTNLTSTCKVAFDVAITGTDVTITKEFSVAVSLAGNGITSKSIYYIATDTATQPSSTDSGWSSTAAGANAKPGQYLWTRTIIKYNEGADSEIWSVSKQGSSISKTTVTYATNTSGTTAPTSGWGTSVPAADPGEYIWTKTVIEYDDGSDPTTYYNVSMMGQTGAKGDKGDKGDAGADAITMTITSSNGTIFKNSSIATTLTAHVYKAGTELTVADNGTVTGLGTVKWYKDGSSTATASAKSITIDADDVASKATYIAQLEG